jgi:hypothetical protein
VVFVCDMFWVWAFAGLGAENSSKHQPEGKGQFVATIDVANPVKQTNDDAVSLDNEHQQNGNAPVQALPKTGLVEGSPKVSFYCCLAGFSLVLSTPV